MTKNKDKPSAEPGTANTTPPDRDHVKHAVYYAVASISGRHMADLEENMVLGGAMPTGVGMDQIAIDAVAAMINSWIAHRGGAGRFQRGELTTETTLKEAIEATEGKF